MSDDPESEDDLRARLFPGKNPDATILLDIKHTACPVHIQPFKARWPMGVVKFQVLGFEWAMPNDAIIRETRRLHGLDADALIAPRMLEQVFAIRPLCCRMPADKLVEIYEATGIGVLKRCKACGRKRLGTPIKATNVVYTHLCFSCTASASATPWGTQ